MNKISGLILIVFLSAFANAPSWFTGKIIYKYSFTDIEGRDISNKMAASFGLEQHYYADDKNYKALNEKQKYVQLYNSATNSYYHFTGNIATKISADVITSKKVIVTTLELKENILGYACKAVQLATDHHIIVYYYSDQIRVNPATYARHHFGEWSKYLDATNGALPLKFVMKDRAGKFIWTAITTMVSRQKMSPADFAFPKGYQLK